MSEKSKYVRCKASNQIKRIAYISKEGDVCLESKLGNLHIIGALGFARDCEHLSDCDSFDWQPEPVESPDDWVTQDRVLFRFGLDENRWTRNGKEKLPWSPRLLTSLNHMHGAIDNAGDCYEVRCRRRDLPPLPQGTPKREYVRLWVNQSCGTAMLMDSSCDIKPKNMDELKHDGTGFYLEDGK